MARVVAERWAGDDLPIRRRVAADVETIPPLTHHSTSFAASLTVQGTFT